MDEIRHSDGIETRWPKNFRGIDTSNKEIEGMGDFYAWKEQCRVDLVNDDVNMAQGEFI